MATLMAELDEHRDPIEKTGAVRKFRDYLPPELVALVEGATKELQPSPKSAPPELSPAKVGRGESPPKKPQLSDKEAKRLLSNPENY